MIADWRHGAVLKSLILKVISALLLLQGCTSVSPGPNPGLEQDWDFEISGKLGVKNGSKGYSARFNWLQATALYDIHVWGPLGQGRTRLQGNSGHMSVTRGDELLAVGAPEAVMARQLGWSLPVSVLPAWIRGQPAPEEPVSEDVRDAQGNYTQFVQAGWEVQLSRYELRTVESRGVEIATPTKIVALNGDRRVTVVVSEYRE